jgi:[acyl-carrier-protein] S-malonyltransferase
MNLAFVFPGQGSQSHVMLEGFKKNVILKNTIEEASDVLGIDFFEIIYGDNKSLLDLTVNTQPVILTVSIALWKIYCDRNGPLPTLLAGHSLGEYSALTASGVMSFNQALKLVSFRAKSMQNAVPAGVGSMAAILGISGDIVREICNDCSTLLKKVEPANFNSISQTVISGENETVDKVCARAKKLGARKVVKLAVSAPFHSSLMAPAAKKLEIRLTEEKFLLPKIPVINNVDVEILKNIDQIKISLAKQAMSPVRWYQTIEKIKESGTQIICECGPGKVLTGLTKRICPEIQSYSFTTEEIISNFVNAQR